MESDLRGRHKRWITFALKQAQKSKMDGYKHCAVLIKSGKPISIGLNGMKAGRLADKLYDLCGWHAECDALCNLSEETIRNSVLYIAGWNKSGNVITSKPCEKCQEYLEKFDLKAIYYSTPEGTVGKYK